MATTKTQCSICNEDKDIYECKGCSETFCFPHLTNHRDTINKQFNQMEDNCNSFRQILLDQKTDPKKRCLVEQVDQWEKDSIQKIKQTANECRQNLIKYTNEYIIEIERKLRVPPPSFKKK